MNRTSTVVSAMAVTGVSVYGGGIAAGHPLSIKPAVGIGVLGFVLLLAANGRHSEVAAKLAVLVATTAVLTSGGKLAGAVARYLIPSNPQV